MIKTQKGKRPEMEMIPGDVPEGLLTIMTKSWAQEPEDRPTFTGEVKHSIILNISETYVKVIFKHEHITFPDILVLFIDIKQSLSELKDSFSSEIEKSHTELFSCIPGKSYEVLIGLY